MTPATLADILKVSKTLHDLIHAEVVIAEAEGKDTDDLVMAGFYAAQFRKAVARYAEGSPE